MDATRENVRQWISTKDFENAVDAYYPMPSRWYWILGGVLTVSPAFPIGLGVLFRGFRERSKVARLRREKKAEATGWEPLLCGVVMANVALLRVPGKRAPAALLGGFGEQDDRYLEVILEKCESLAGLYGKEPESIAPEWREAAVMIQNDTYQRDRRQQLPASFADERGIQLFDAVVEQSLIPGFPQGLPLVLCLGPVASPGPLIAIPFSLAVMRERPERMDSPTIIRHEVPVDEAPVVAPVCENLEEIDAHLMKHLGEVSWVFHEIVSTTIHLDLHIIPPTEARPWNTLVTTGMSEIPMNVPEGAEPFRLAELLIRLPADWPLRHEDFEKEEFYWPLRWLKILARFAHEYQTWLGYGHTVPNGNPPKPVVDSVPFVGMLLAAPMEVPEGFSPMMLSDGHPVHFWSMIPITAEEMDFKLKHGADALLERLLAAGHSDLLNVHRESVC
nr:suppressor of fused domain protein [Haloferula luteola]